MTAPLIGPARAFDLAHGDLAAVSARLTTMFEAGWWPAQPDHDRPTRPPAAGGPQFDCGLGDERARQAWARLTGHLTAAEQQATDVLCAAVDTQSRCVPVCRHASLLDAQSSVARLRERLTALQRLWALWAGNVEVAPTWQVDIPRSQWLARQLMGERSHTTGSAFWHLEQARYDAQKIVREVGNGRPPAACPKCRRTGSIGQPRKGGLCHACYQTKYRLERRQRQHAARRDDAA